MAEILETEDAAPRAGPAPFLFAMAVFGSAALIFIVEPMLARLLLPQLGGSSMVWNTSLAFFQAALLLGYAYAHLLQRVASLHRQMLIHLAVLIVAALSLPLRITGVLGEPSVNLPALWLVAVLTVSVGAPFAALSATAPLIQAWYARLHGQGADGRDPYVLYAASNLGSLLALLAYPLVIEPFTRLGHQAIGWSLGYAGFAGLIGLMIALGWRARDRGEAVEEPATPRARAPWRTRLIWVLLAAAPSSLLLGVTGHITADVASAPFLWVVPLALYLLTFIFAFQARSQSFERFSLLMQIILLPEALLLYAVAGAHPFVQLPVHLLAFFFTAQVCAFALARRRPPKEQLTEFYLWMSVGGVLGGGFNAFVAPMIFSGVWEYPIVLILACLARPWSRQRMTYFEKGCFWTALICCAGLLFPSALPAHMPLELSQEIKVALMLAPAVSVMLMRQHTRAVTVALGVLAMASYVPNVLKDGAESHRSFFGVIQLKDRQIAGVGSIRVMIHGSTVHGTQREAPAFRCQPTTYYTPRTPMGQVFHAEAARRPGMAIGVVGLGSGSVATYVRASDTLRFYEIDPAVVRIALDPAKFSYVRGCAKGPVDVMLGDARLQLEKAAPASFDLLLIDAFSSDSVPTHLMTVEAMRDYLRVLKPGGVVMLHLSNRNLDLGGPAEAAMRGAGGYILQQLYYSDEKNTYLESSSHVLVAAREPRTLEPYTNARNWTYQPMPARAWTDDYTNVAGAIWSRLQHQTLQ